MKKKVKFIEKKFEGVLNYIIIVVVFFYLDIIKGCG